MEEEKVDKTPDLKYAQMKFSLGLSDALCPPEKKAQIKTELMKVVKEESMEFFYRALCRDLKWAEDAALLAEMKKTNEEKLQKLEATLKDAIDNLGESEVRDAHHAKAKFYAIIGDKATAEQQFRVTFEKTVGPGQKLDIIFILIRLGLFWNDYDIITRNLEKAKSLMETGSDWDRRNRLKVYEALYNLSVRVYRPAAKLLLDTVSTFSAVELMDYEEYVYYLVISALLSLTRVQLKDKVINSPEVLAVIENIPHLSSFLNSFYQCDYALFFKSLAGITDSMKTNRFLAPHAGVFCKEFRVLAYKQMLDAYKSVELSAMARNFNVTVEYLDDELSRFIASGRLNCKIDKVSGIVETTRRDSKSAVYMKTIKQGDNLLNKVQKLSRVINL